MNYTFTIDVMTPIVNVWFINIYYDADRKCLVNQILKL
jgi:hypothetical protein